MFNILFPLVAGLVLLLAPVRPKTSAETPERVARRKKMLRWIGGIMLVIAGAQLLIKVAAPKPAAASMEPPPPLKTPAQQP